MIWNRQSYVLFISLALLNVFSTQSLAQNKVVIIPLAADKIDQVYAPENAQFELNNYVTNFAISPDNYTGNVTYIDTNDDSWRGRPATTAICQDLMGSGARLCETDDISRMIAAGMVNMRGQTDLPNGLSLPESGSFWISSGGDTFQHSSSTNAHNNADCYHWTNSSGSRGTAPLYSNNNNAYPYGFTTWGRCNSSFPLLCCR